MSVYYRTIMGEGITNQEKSAARRLFVGSAIKLTAFSFLYATLVAGDEEYEGQEDYIKIKISLYRYEYLKHLLLQNIEMVKSLFKVLPERTYSNDRIF